MNKRTFVIVGLVVAVGVGIAAWQGQIPPKFGTQGTIGAADRYLSPQLASEDVAVDPTAINDLLQSDVFHRLLANPEFRKMTKIEAFRTVVSGSDFKRLAPEKSFQELLQNAKFASLVSDPAVQKFYTMEQNKKASSSVETEANRAKKITMEVNRANNALTDVNKAETSGKDLTEHNKKFVEELNKAAVPSNFVELLKSEGFNEVARSPAFASIVTSKAFQALAANPEFGKFAEVLASDDFKKLATTKIMEKDLGRTLGASDVQKAINAAERP